MATVTIRAGGQHGLPRLREIPVFARAHQQTGTVGLAGDRQQVFSMGFSGSAAADGDDDLEFVPVRQRGFRGRLFGTISPLRSTATFLPAFRATPAGRLIGEPSAGKD